MTRFSHFAAPMVLGAAMFAGTQGCASEAPDVSADSTMLSEGRKTVSASAPHDGLVYIFDDTSNGTVYSGKVEQGDTVKVDAEHNRVLLNDKVALEKDLINDHRYQIYFNREELSEADIARYRQQQSPNTVIVQPAPSNTTVVQPAQPAPSNTTVVQPAQPAPSNTTVVQPAQPAPSNTTIIQPPPPQSDATVIPPPPAPDAATPGTTVIQPDGTTVVTPSR